MCIFVFLLSLLWTGGSFQLSHQSLKRNEHQQPNNNNNKNNKDEDVFQIIYEIHINIFIETNC